MKYLLIIKNYYVKIANKIKNFICSIEQAISHFIKKKPKVFNFLVNYLDKATKIIGFVFGKSALYILLGLYFYFIPIFYNIELLQYYEHLSNVGFSLVNVCFAIFQFLPIPLQLIFLFIVFFSLLISSTTPLLFISCLTEQLQSLYGADVLKLRHCNNSFTPANRFIGLVVCFVCGQDSASRVIAHKLSTDAWRRVAEINPSAAGPMPTYQGTFGQSIGSIGSIIDSMRGKK
jgi:hypothetical protein